MTIYSAYILAGIILYAVAGMPLFDAVNHSISALSTGGFSTRIDSIGAYNSLGIELITIILMFLGTTNFAAHYVLLQGNIKRFFQIGEVRFLFFLLFFSIPIVSFFSLQKIYGSLGSSLRIGAFQVFSALSTTGYSTVSFDKWDSFSILIIIALMLVGGGTGSTAGGLKLYRVYLLLKSLLWNIQKYILPKKIVNENYVFRSEGKYYVTQGHIVEISNYFVLYMITFLVGTLILVANGYSLQDSLFEFASTLGTVGLSVGVTGPQAPAIVLWAETFGMLLGRLEFLALFYAIIKIVRDARFMGTQRMKDRSKT